MYLGMVFLKAHDQSNIEKNNQRKDIVKVVIILNKADEMLKAIYIRADIHPSFHKEVS